ncbi:MAG: hypothetical protein Q8S20_12960 [Sulfuritalea sp.]|nr:hypothetical protein [Sulfuritalea sp.]
MPKKTDASNPRFHYEIWSGPLPDFGVQRKAICYVENHNASCGYAELALDFSYAANLLIEEYRKTRLGNWMAPIAHISRQVIELRLKALMDSIKVLDNSFDTTLLGGHNLESIWSACHTWLLRRSYKLQEDARLEMTEHLISAFHEIDPSGDLFRFGVSRRTAFNKQKSYDRVDIEVDLFEQEFEATQGLLHHWEAVVFRENMKRKLGWTKDPLFDADNFPRRP